MEEREEEEVRSISTTPPTRPANARSVTEPSPAILLQGFFKENEKYDWGRPTGHRNRSPYSRSHLRSRSSGSALLTAPAMTRAHSMPNPHTPGSSFDRSPSSSGSLSPSPGSHSPKAPARPRSPYKSAEESPCNPPPPRSPKWFDSPSTLGGSGIEAIQEDSELDITPRAQQLPQPSAMHAVFSRSGSLRKRPASPLHSLPTTSFPASVIDQNAPLSLSMSSASSSPSLGPQRYNESYPSLHHYASSSSFSNSIPSTPTSARSRSPSISSLETIEDAPEQEESEAVERDMIERLKLAAERAEDGEPRRSSLDTPASGGRGFGFARTTGGRGAAQERKRWSICGGERRADLDLETIWED